VRYPSDFPRDFLAPVDLAGNGHFVRLLLVSIRSVEARMKNGNRKLYAGYLGIVILLTCSLALAADAPANVAGTWKVSVTGGAGNAEQTIILQQDGNKITGTFKGPRQSGPLEGTVEGKNISFHVATRVPLDYKGTVDGDTMKGTLMGNGKAGDWAAKRSS
jgi:hypothetical protein